ncbi:hypothetical protein MNBD_PLANCTO02-807 [hydrothermal vent metagenome]|uniref:Membrane transporter protein n=1 Tax=hydrothermal vent metagenome TaxID=652676 RepID=A0A3B1E3W9_9ZZZZ
MEYEFLFLSCFVLSVTFAGFAQSFLGFGYAIVALSILQFFIDIQTANLVVSIGIVFPLLYMAWGIRGELEWEILRPALGGAAIGLPVGVSLFFYLDPLWLMRGTGATILVIACYGLISQRHDAERKTSSVWGVVAGLASGFLAGSVSIGGPPITAYAVSQPWSARKYRAFLFSFALSVYLFKIMIMIAIGAVSANLFTKEILFLSALAIPFGTFGAWLGIQMAKRVDSQRFKKIVLLSLASVSILILMRDSKQTVNNSTAPQTTLSPLKQSSQP